MEELAKLDFLLAEMRRWWEAGRVPPALLQPLYDEYAARRAALIARQTTPVAPRPATATTTLAEYDLSEEAPKPGWSLVAFLEKNNIAALHLVGAALLLVGLIALVQWQWASWGRFLLPVLLGGTALGLMLGGDRLRKTEPQSGRVLSLLGAAIVPLTVIAFQALRLSEGMLTWESAWALAGGVGAAVSAWRWVRTRDTLLIPLFFIEAATLIGVAAPDFLLREVGWLALAISGLLAARQQETKDVREAFGGSGLILTALMLVGGIAHGNDAMGGATLLGGAVTLGLAAVVLRIGWPGYGASAFTLLGTAWLAPTGSHAEAAMLAGTGLILAAVAAWHRRTDMGAATPYQRSSWAAALLAFPLVAFQTLPAVWGFAFAGIAVLWGVLARAEKDYDAGALHAALGVGLLAARLGALPVDATFVAATHLAPCPERWLLLAALGLGLVRGRASRHVAGVALAWACAFQIPLLDKPEGLVALILAATGTALWSYIARSAIEAGMALIPLFMAAVVVWGARAFGNGAYGHHWLLAPWVLAIGFAACGLAYLSPQPPPPGAPSSLREGETESFPKPLSQRGTIARERAGAQWLGGGEVLPATLWSVAAAHLAAAFLPGSLIDFWPLATLPVLFWLSTQIEDDSPAWLGVVTFALFFAVSAPETTMLSIVGGAIALTALGLGLYRERGLSMSLGGGIATATFLLAAEGTLAYHGFLAALVSVIWQGAAAALRRSAEWRWRSFSTLGLVVSAVSATLSLAGVLEADQGRWAVFGLATVALGLSGAAGIRREIACLHAAFTAALTAFGIFLFDRIGFGPDRLDWFLLPVGIYLLLIAEVRKQSMLRLPGVLFTLAPSLLAAWLTPDQWSHSILLAAECLAFIALGIGRHTRAYLGGGVLFLVSLLIVRLWDPLKEINYGVYLTLLGVGVLTAAIAFERRREAMLAWAQSVKDKYDGWE